ncbi:prepilin-type N-terminal cleavage/methylation domain-containing protein [bacterium]|nr:prepilin-type N-terminal cleavage/methylation domain-containing protein [bacterium]
MEKQKKDIGFTLLELIISVAVILLLSVLVVASYERQGYRIVLMNASHQVAQDIRMIEEKAMAPDKGVLIYGPLGVHIEYGTSVYFYFFDEDRNNLYSSPNDSVLEKKALPGNISFLNPVVSTGTTDFSVNSVDIVFINPDPKIKITGNTGVSFPEGDRVAIKLFNSNISVTSTVNVYQTGLIEIK